MGTQQKIDAVLSSLYLSEETLRDVMRRLRGEMEKGLHKNTHQYSNCRMWITYVRSLPNGSESGEYLALDLGGTNLRILLGRLKEGQMDIDNRSFRVPNSLMTGTGQQLFDYIAQCIADFKEEMGLPQQKALPLGFTYSFPCLQNDLTSATQTSWTKGFTASGVVGKDIVQLLREACSRKKVAVDVKALINDTTGTMVACAYNNPNCYAGLILATGTNACYLEDISNVERWDGDNDDPRHVIINIDWGAFGSQDKDGSGLLEDLRTGYDRIMDLYTPNTGKSMFEKMISGMYLGELVRIILITMAKDNVIFNGCDLAQINQTWAFETRFISDIENDKSEANDECKTVLQSLGINTTPQDLAIVREVCSAISTRAARLLSAAMATVVLKVNRKQMTVGVDGTLYRKHPKFHSTMTSLLPILAPGHEVEFALSEDGSGKGAVLVAASVAKQ